MPYTKNIAKLIPNPKQFFIPYLLARSANLQNTYSLYDPSLTVFPHSQEIMMSNAPTISDPTLKFYLPLTDTLSLPQMT